MLINKIHTLLCQAAVHLSLIALLIADVLVSGYFFFTYTKCDYNNIKYI